MALYQIITLINSERYKAVYGDDPFHPLIPKTYNPTIQENVRVLITPNMNEIDEQKQRNALNDFMSKKNASVQPVISVIPVNYAENGSQHKVKKRNWMQPKWATRSRNPLIVPPVHNDTSTIDNSYSEAYNHWQWSELAPAVSARKTKNIYKYLE